MDDKKLYELLQKYAESTRNDRQVAFKKLNASPKEAERPTQKKFKPIYAFAIAMSLVVIVLCITLPLTLTGKQDNIVSPRYCQSADIGYNQETSIDVLKEQYGIVAIYPNYTASSVVSIFSYTDSNLRGALLGYVKEDDFILFVDLAIVPKNYILDIYENYFTFPDVQQWEDLALKYQQSLNSDTMFYDMKIYFADSKYDYFVSASSEQDLDVTYIMDILYKYY